MLSCNHNKCNDVTAFSKCSAKLKKDRGFGQNVVKKLQAKRAASLLRQWDAIEFS
jgi:hypothetical protein